MYFDVVDLVNRSFFGEGEGLRISVGLGLVSWPRINFSLRYKA